MRKPYCFIIWGISDSGKDTICSLLQNHIYVENVKFSQPCKSIIERWLNLPYNSLNDKQFREKKVKNTVTNKLEEYTYGDLLVKAYEAWEVMTPGGWLTVGYLINQVTQINNPTNIAFTDVRRKIELQAIKKELSSIYTLVFIHVEGRGTEKKSDKELSIKDFNFIDCSFYIDNNPLISIEELDSEVKGIVNSL